MSTIRNNPDENRYEIHEDDQLAGFSEYKFSGSQISFTHTEVESAFSGRGLARQLVVEALEDARTKNLTVLPFCPYVRKVIAESPEQYLELVPASQRARFELPDAGDES